MPTHRKEVKKQIQTIVTINPKNNYSFFNHKKETLWLRRIKNPAFQNRLRDFFDKNGGT
jgi:hypothetical protein